MVILLLKNFRVYVGNKVYFASQLCFDLNEGMNSNTSDLSAGGIFVYSYDEATRTVEFKVKEGLSYSVKIPTDEELPLMLAVFGIVVVFPMIVKSLYQ